MNFAGQVKDIAGGELKINTKELVKVSASTAYGGSKLGKSTSQITKVGVYAPQLLGFGSSYSTNTVTDENGNVKITESYNIGIGAFGVQINMDGLGVKDFRFGLDSGVSVALGIGADLSGQMGLIYINH